MTVDAYDFSYEGVRRVVYGDGATFVPVCEKCGRFVKAPELMTFSDGGDGPPVKEPHTTCSRCGPTQMLFEGFIG